MKVKSNLFGKLIFGLILISAIGCKKEEELYIVRDIDGNKYHTVVIGTQEWMVENLRVTHFNDGSEIPFVADILDWNNLTSWAYCVYDNIIDNSKTYGRLYNFYAVEDPQKLCPAGWHVPTNEDWEELADFLGGKSIAADKLKEAGTEHWYYADPDVTDEFGFAALPGGQRGLGSEQGYFDLRYAANYWSSDVSESFTNLAYGWVLMINAPDINTSLFNKSDGLSVRCVKD